jgi:uncharacterized repeat protein (TIGR03943 family)
VSRETENVLLLLVGIATAMISIVGTYTRYVKPALMPWLVATAVLLITLARTASIRDVRRGHAHNDDGHIHRTGIAWLLVVPIAILIFVVPPALGAQSAAPSVTVVSNDVLRHPFPPLAAERAPVVALPEVLRRVVNDTAGTLDGRLITITGFTMKEGPAIDLGRVVIICCAADAQVARIHLVGPAAATAAGLPENTWIQVEGEVEPGPRDASGLTIPSMTLTSVTRIDPPENAYAY